MLRTTPVGNSLHTYCARSRYGEFWSKVRHLLWRPGTPSGQYVTVWPSWNFGRRRLPDTGVRNWARGAHGSETTISARRLGQGEAFGRHAWSFWRRAAVGLAAIGVTEAGHDWKRILVDMLDGSMRQPQLQAAGFGRQRERHSQCDSKCDSDHGGGSLNVTGRGASTQGDGIHAHIVTGFLIRTPQNRLFNQIETLLLPRDLWTFPSLSNSPALHTSQASPCRQAASSMTN